MFKYIDASDVLWKAAQVIATTLAFVTTVVLPLLSLAVLLPSHLQVKGHAAEVCAVLILGAAILAAVCTWRGVDRLYWRLRR